MSAKAPSRESLRFTRARLMFKKGSWEFNPLPFGEESEDEEYITKPIKGDKNGGTRKVLAKKPPVLLPLEPGMPRNPDKVKAKPPKLRASLTPGTIVILLAGANKGRRAVFLKQLPSGLLLVTGPRPLNLISMRRIGQSYVIATKTKLDISGVKVPDHINDDYFRREKRKKQKARDVNIFASETKSREIPEEKKKDQIAIDKQILSAISKHPEKKFMKGYLSSTFGLKKRQPPHSLVF